MKPISYQQWKRYKESAEGKEAIAAFEQLLSDDVTPADMLAVAKRYNPQFFKNCGPNQDQYYLERLSDLMEVIGGILSQNNYDWKSENAPYDFYADVICSYFTYKDDGSHPRYGELTQRMFKDILSDNMFLSLVLYSYVPSDFLPNLFLMQFIYLQMIADKYEMQLPEIPKRSDYQGRNTYYLQLVASIIELVTQDESLGLTSPAEVCAFIYDYEMTLAKEDFEYQHRNETLPKQPGQAWLLVGNMNDAEKEMDFGFWQAGDLTSKGDIMLFYEKSPVKAMNAIWIAQADGVVDPFFHYYSNTYIGDKIEIPADKAITFEEFKASPYFQTKGEKVILNKDKTPKIGEDGKPVVTHEGNYVAKNFQDCSGWEVTRADYAEIKRMLEAKGFDTSILPSLYEPRKIGNIVIENENDVYVKLVTPLLEQMGWSEGKDFEREVEFPAGRTETRSADKRPDYCLHITRRGNDIEAKVIIEAKAHMKNAKEIQENFEQGRTYAKWGNAKVLVICDDVQIRVYVRDFRGKFNEKDCVKFSWLDMEDGDKYEKLKKMLS